MRKATESKARKVQATAKAQHAPQVKQDAWTVEQNRIIAEVALDFASVDRIAQTDYATSKPKRRFIDALASKAAPRAWRGLNKAAVYVLVGEELAAAGPVRDRGAIEKKLQNCYAILRDVLGRGDIRCTGLLPLGHVQKSGDVPWLQQVIAAELILRGETYTPSAEHPECMPDVVATVCSVKLPRGYSVGAA